MTEKAPVIDVVIDRRGDAWRMVFAPASWLPGMLQVWTHDREIFPVARPEPTIAHDAAFFVGDHLTGCGVLAHSRVSP